ncbi:MAG TPA: NAD-dependent DNA ligase LigA [Treponemataceae bacterium]|nr:NAD-dependent DNA ligase LigA [Treponemataceae bacterium]HPS43946.1 NAD-dependent DNA ligase LigA [Treponemataceae bacterium]
MARKNRARELERAIKHHQDLYYNGNPEISDADFDVLWDELKGLEPDNPLFSTINSESTDGFPKEYHLIPMGSQEKAANPEAFEAWAEKMAFDEFIVQYKLDGASLELQYERGSFAKAVTRGDGRIGDDITANARKMRGVVPVLSGESGPKGAHPFSGGVRGEVIMTHAVHDEFFSDKANCRNAANGLMKRKDGSGSERLEVICYDAAPGIPGSPFTGYMPFSDEYGKLEWLKGNGFTTVPTETCAGAHEVIEYRARVMDARSSIDYDIDGLVIKGREIDPADLARSRPEKQIAFKFSLEEAVTVLREVEWSESGATYTPIARIDPVQLAGTCVQRANLANPNMIASMNLRIGSRVVVTKRGEIIPKIEALVSNPEDSVPIGQPDACAACGSALVDEGTRLFCPNPECPKLIHHRIEKWIGVLDVRDFGELLIKRLFDSGRVRSIPDLYTLTLEELSALDRMGDLSAAKALKSLRAKSSVSLAQFVAGFDIEGIGETMVEKLVASGYDTLEKLKGADEESIAEVYQFGQIMARALKAGLASLAGEMDALLSSGAVTIKPPVAGGILSGLSFCFTGELESMKRPEAEARVKELGGQAKSSVVKGLSFLVTNSPDSGSSKNAKARDLGVAIIDEAAFLGILEGKMPASASNSAGAKKAKTDARSQMELNL